MKRIIKKLTNIFSWQREKLAVITAYAEAVQPWWGSFDLAVDQTKFWHIGNIMVCVVRFATQWHIACHNSCAPLQFKTFTLELRDCVQLQPVLADRPIVASLENTLHIPAGGRVSLYVSAPAWVRVIAANPVITIDEIACMELRHTWFGENTIDGGFCYTAKIKIATNISDLPSGADRITIPIVIKNDSPNILDLKKISVPLQFLSVYCDAGNHLWTEQITITQDITNMPAIKISRGIIRMTKGMQLLSKARIKPGVGVKQFLDTLIWK
ncbi:MAG: hypothetical protein COC15_04950 [Legionellales bacterium]|nr:MAG: hypothetical protein COC15_04950 [Legionellales bacterium]